ncbi:HD domain-containing protein [Rhodopila sp.]|uniref:HD domain-containing protein n=1 Tax=Rhodopila sp. TaxID=2480087 RepID=UPI003D0B2B83
MRTSEFGDQAGLAERLLAELGPGGNDGSHDRSHLLRVWRNAKAIAAGEVVLGEIAPGEPGCDQAILAAAVILHDCVAVEKNAPDRSRASRLAAGRARDIVGRLGWNADRTDRLAHAIEAHSFSAGITPSTIEARILQDADRLDAIGAIGIARCFYVAGRMGSALYSPDDPAASTRPLDDQRFALDHFGAKLFKVADAFQTTTGQTLADQRTRAMLGFHEAFLAEVGG